MVRGPVVPGDLPELTQFQLCEPLGSGNQAVFRVGPERRRCLLGTEDYGSHRPRLAASPCHYSYSLGCSQATEPADQCSGTSSRQPPVTGANLVAGQPG